jgi:2,5-diketo-D-gluconate reductase B
MCDILPTFGLGTYRLKGECVYETVKSALMMGYTHIDTAELYKNQKEVGAAIRDSGVDRRQLFLTTKIDPYMIRDGLIQESLDRSLQDLGMDYVDLVLLHAPVSDVAAEWEELVKIQSANKKKFRHIGVSNYKIEHLKALEDSPIKPFCNQIEITPFLQRIDLHVECVQAGIPIVAHSSLTKGKKFNDPVLTEISQDCELDPSEILLKWGLSQGITVLPRTGELEHLEQNLRTCSTKPFLPDGVFEKLCKLNCGFATHAKYL